MAAAAGRDITLAADVAKGDHLRSLVVEPSDDIDTMIMYADICMDFGRPDLSRRCLVDLLRCDPGTGPLPSPLVAPEVSFAYTRYLWRSGSKDAAIAALSQFVSDLAPHTDETNLRARCASQLGLWMTQLHGFTSRSMIDEIISHHALAVQLDANQHEAWRAWAFANYQAILSLDHMRREGDTFWDMATGRSRTSEVLAGFKRRSASEPPPSPNMRHQNSEKSIQEAISRCAVSAVRGFFTAIRLSPSQSTQDALRLLTLWFNFGHDEPVRAAIAHGRAGVSIDTWLDMIPQFIARLDSHGVVRDSIEQVLLDIGKRHPQAVVIPLNVAVKSSELHRFSVAKRILEKLQSHHGEIVAQTTSMIDELVRVAVLRHELWNVGLLDASKAFYDNKDYEGTVHILQGLHSKHGPATTLSEMAFDQMFSASLAMGKRWMDRYIVSHHMEDFAVAWRYYHDVFRRIEKMLPNLAVLELQQVSPRLYAARDIPVAVPGTYNANSPVVYISSFGPKLEVIMSKQRPRKFSLRGSDGQEYQYLLKGHEDPRLDERVMMFFGLVNTLLSSNAETAKSLLSIKRYSITPLSPSSGLIGWVPNCDTLYSLIRAHRDARKSGPSVHAEHAVYLKYAPDTRDSRDKPTDRGFDRLTVLQKLEIFRLALASTPGNDLAEILWEKSPSAEVWLQRRVNFTRSVAVMSMVGHVLGLGDRHLSNLMLDRFTGHVVHIDFGDCFEVAKQRDKFPERVPFRLTRMMINAMGVSGINGVFDSTSESVMGVLRANKDSLLAVLDAFVHDPILSWQLVIGKKTTQANAVSVRVSEDQSRNLPPRQGVTEEKEEAEDAAAAGAEKGKPQQQPPQQQQANPSMDEFSASINEKASQMIKRVECKLQGDEFAGHVGHGKQLSVKDQVQMLIQSATSHESLCQAYIGWFPFW
eukprot:m.209872 g.209872  ORF g.209872 m.209872 type:complete len:925 (-) comp17813_c0_seq1:564-3338(-)